MKANPDSRAAAAAGIVLGALASLIPLEATAQPDVPGHRLTECAMVAGPRGVSFDGAGQLYTVERDDGEVHAIDAQCDIVMPPCAALPPSPFGYIGPHYDAVSGRVFLSEYLARTGTRVVTTTCDGTVAEFVDDAAINPPAGLATDAAGNLYVSVNNCPGTVAKVTVDANGVPVSTDPNFADGLCRPDGLAIGPDAHLYVSDRGTHRIMKVPLTGGTATEVAAGFDDPIALAFDDEGDLYVANFGGDTIAKVTLPAAEVSVFGSGFQSPAGIAVDPGTQQLAIADFGAGIVYKTRLPVGGSVTGMIPWLVLCVNATAGERVIIAPRGERSWDCEAEGLPVTSGDTVWMLLGGPAD